MRIFGQTANNILNFPKLVNNQINALNINDLLKYLDERGNSEMRIIINKLSKIILTRFFICLKR